MAFRRAAVVLASAIVAVNIWTGAPLLALWVGSHAAGSTVLSMRAVAVVVGVLTGCVFTLARTLLWLNAVYRRLAALETEQRQPRWLAPLADEQRDIRMRASMTPVEWVLLISVQLAVGAFLFWFFFLAGSPLPG